MKILVVDDEQLLVKGMKFNLENEGYTVETAYDGATAIDMAKSGLHAHPRIFQCAHHHADRPQRGRRQDHRP